MYSCFIALVKSSSIYRQAEDDPAILEFNYSGEEISMEGCEQDWLYERKRL